MELPWIARSFSWLRGRRGKARRILLKTLSVAGLVAAAIALVSPLTYDEQAHLTFNNATRRWAAWGDQLIGFDVTAPRQNIFTLARDLDRVIVIADHGTVYESRMLGLANFVSRGSIHTTADALRWFNIPLTKKQAAGLKLCRELDQIRESDEIVIQPDPYQYGIASWYGPGFHGRLAASGEIYNMYDQTAAHKTLPMQSVVRVVSQRTGRSTVVRINDRGPYVGGRIIDMSHRSKQSLGMQDIAAVYIERIDPAALDVACDDE